MSIFNNLSAKLSKNTPDQLRAEYNACLRIVFSGRTANERDGAFAECQRIAKELARRDAILAEN